MPDFRSNLCFFFVWIMLFFTPNPAFSQTRLKKEASVQDTTRKIKNTFVGVPVVYYLPETNWGFGAAGLFAFRFRNQKIEERPSQLQFVGSYTLNKQLISLLNFNLFPNNGLYNLKGELGYYQFSYFYYGIGKDARFEDEESFGVNYPRVEVNFSKKWLGNWYAGVRYRFNQYHITSVEKGGLLDFNPVPGKSGSIISSLGLISIFDHRDNVFASQKGWYLETSLMFNGPYFGSDFDYQRLTVDYRTYLTNKWQHTFVLNLYGMFISGQAPFNELAFIGGSKIARGYYPGRYRDKQLLLLQAAYRFPLFWKLGAEAFTSYGGVGEDFQDFTINDFLWNYGLGLRLTLNEMDRINLRFDVGLGGDEPNFYFTVGEAF